MSTLLVQVNTDKARSWLLVSFSLIVVLWVRLQPLALSGLEEQVDQIARNIIRDRITQEVSRQPPLPRPVQFENVERQVNDWIAQHPSQFGADKVAIRQRLQSDFQYEGQDGQNYVYLGDFDSYLWLRHARNYLRTGTTCDAVVAGECRDAYANAPVGARMRYNRSMHIVAIVGLHKALTFFQPAYPLAASAFWVPILIGMLVVLPAFFIGWRLAGNVGGLCAALLSALDPILLVRSIGSDSDVWNVFLPLCMMAAAIAALDVQKLRWQITYALLAGGFAGLHAGTWSGWIFFYGVLLAGLVGCVAFSSARYRLSHQTCAVWQSAEVQRAALVTIVFYLATGFCSALAGTGPLSLALPFTILARFPASILDFLLSYSPAEVPNDPVWPDVFATVAELQKPAPGVVTVAEHDTLFFCGALAWGLLLLLRVFRIQTSIPSRVHPGAVLIIIVWFLAGLYITRSGNRFLLLLGTPLAIVVATGGAWLHESLRSIASGTVRPSRTIVSVLVLTMVLFSPLQHAYFAARTYLPRMNDAWWKVLTNIRELSQPDAIINLAWDYGHWAKYVAERRVSSDGASLLTHVPHWLSLVFLAQSERESIGLLRMLNCGSDAAALPEGRHGAYRKVLAKVGDAHTARASVVALSSLDHAKARAYLAQRHFTESEQADILRATHCTPPEAYLVISSEQRDHALSWIHLGMRNVRGSSTTLPSGYISPRWLPCITTRPSAVLECTGDVQGLLGNANVHFVYDPAAPSNSRLHFHSPAAGSSLSRSTQSAPAMLILAQAQGMQEVSFSPPIFPDLGVLLDVPNQRILVGTPLLLRSQFVRLLYLDGRYATYYEKFDERTLLTGGRVIAWKVRWEALNGK